MPTQRAGLALLTMLLVAGAALPAAAGSGRHGVPRVTLTADGPGTLIAIRFGSDPASHVHFVYTREALEGVVLADLDHDGDVDIIAAPRGGELMFWRNAGHGRFALATLPRDSRWRVTYAPLITRIEKAGEGWQCGDDRHDAAMPRGPGVAGDVLVAAVRGTTPVYVRPSAFRRFSGRAPPVL